MRIVKCQICGCDIEVPDRMRTKYCELCRPRVRAAQKRIHARILAEERMTDCKLVTQAHKCAFGTKERSRARGSLAADVGFYASKEGTVTTWRGRPCAAGSPTFVRRFL